MTVHASDRIQPAAHMQADKHAFKLLMALATDLSDHLPPGFSQLVIGKARNRDYRFFVVDFPHFVGRLAADMVVGHQGVFEPFRDAWDTRSIEAAYLLGNLLKKYPFSESKEFPEHVRRNRALASFRKANRWCRSVNRLGRAQREHPLILEARRIIADILPAFKWEEAIKRSYFGPGVNVGASWDETDTQMKLYLDKTLTRPLAQRLDFAATLVPAYLYYEGLRVARDLNFTPKSQSGDLETPLNNRYSFLVALGLVSQDLLSNVVAGSKYSAVPKDAMTLRSIAAEPMLNSFLQNGLGVWMREILGRYSAQLDCTDQTRNRDLAYAGSSAGWLATIDLSSASDTISAQLVKNLLPPDWYQAMRLIRSPVIEIDGKNEKLHMFSSMGNGYTFPLETLVFYAISAAAVRLADSTADLAAGCGGPGANREPSVYGDDIIVLASDAPAVLKALRDCGFWPNAKKSFYKGPFRESCGHDYRAGNYIRPVFLRRPLEWSFDVISLINHLSNPAGFGWYSQRYGKYFNSFCSCLVDLTSQYPSIPAGPIADTHVVTHVRMPLQLCRSVGAVRTDVVSEPSAAKPTTTEMFFPLRVTPRKFADIEDIAVYLKALLQPPEETATFSSLYTRVKRGEVTVRLPRRDAGSPILGWDDDPVFRSIFNHYWADLRRIRWYQPSERKRRSKA